MLLLCFLVLESCSEVLGGRVLVCFVLALLLDSFGRLRGHQELVLPFFVHTSTPLANLRERQQLVLLTRSLGVKTVRARVTIDHLAL
jgi:hypothetical protein